MGATAEIEPGEVFAGRYEVQRVLGEGDRKRTYLARDAKLGRLAALSLIKPDAALSDPEGTEREAKVLGSSTGTSHRRTYGSMNVRSLILATSTPRSPSATPMTCGR